MATILFTVENTYMYM